MTPVEKDEPIGTGPPGRRLVGRALGPYQVLSLLGAGGMGEVYRARDPRLGRDVAVKVLPADLAASGEAHARFEREVRAVAALSHPNILAIHDFGVEAGIAYAVMELLEGESLRARLAHGPLPWRKAVALAIQIADGLAAAHARGIVHRDLKPENVFLTAPGQAKILDFGLARLLAAPAAPDGTTVGGGTEPGTFLGTVGYVSPEQVRGEEAGPASDIFAFGCVLHEMLSGRAPFTRATPMETLAAVLRDEPAPISGTIGASGATGAGGASGASGALGDLPAPLEALVVRCLEKRPVDRFQSASDLGFVLRSIGGAVSAGPGEAPVAVASARRARWPLAAAVACGLVLGAVGTGLLWRRAAPAANPAGVVRLSLLLPAGSSFAPNDSPAAGSSVALSSDGRALACSVLRQGRRVLAVRALDRFEERVLPGTEGAASPFFSPDGEWIAYFTEKELRKVPRVGGTPSTVASVPPVARGAVWGPDGTIFFSPVFSMGIQGVAAAGGRPRDVTTVDFAAGESNHLLPEVLPGGRTLLYTLWKGGDFGAASVWAFSPGTGARKLLLESATAPRYLAPGFLVFARGGALFAVRFDAGRLAVEGEPVPMVDGVWTDRATGTAHYAVAGNGTLAYVPGADTIERRRLAWVDRQGRVEPLPLEPSFFANPRLSPDGRRVAVEALNDLWVYDLAEGTLLRATFRGVNQHPVWTPDGRHLTFCSSRGTTDPKLFWTDVEAGGEPAALAAAGGVQFPGSWSPDGRTLAYAEIAGVPTEADTDFDIRLLQPGATPPASVLVRTRFKEDQPRFSPDGRALAYVSDETGQLQVYLRPFPEAGRRLRVSVDGGTEPVWSRRGDELFFRSGRQYFAVPVATGGALAVGRPALLFEGDFVIGSLTPGFQSYDVAPDGRRFLVVERADDTPRPARLDLVLGWTAELERRLAPRAAE